MTRFILGKDRPWKKPWVIRDVFESQRVIRVVFDFCDRKGGLRKKQYEAKVAREKEDWISNKCEEIKICQNNYNSKRA